MDIVLFHNSNDPYVEFQSKWRLSRKNLAATKDAADLTKMTIGQQRRHFFRRRQVFSFAVRHIRRRLVILGFLICLSVLNLALFLHAAPMIRRHLNAAITAFRGEARISVSIKEHHHHHDHHHHHHREDRLNQLRWRDQLRLAKNTWDRWMVAVPKNAIENRIGQELSSNFSILMEMAIFSDHRLTIENWQSVICITTIRNLLKIEDLNITAAPRMERNLSSTVNGSEPMIDLERILDTVEIAKSIEEFNYILPRAKVNLYKSLTTIHDLETLFLRSDHSSQATTNNFLTSSSSTSSACSHHPVHFSSISAKWVGFRHHGVGLKEHYNEKNQVWTVSWLSTVTQYTHIAGSFEYGPTFYQRFYRVRTLCRISFDVESTTERDIPQYIHFAMYSNVQNDKENDETKLFRLSLYRKWADPSYYEFLSINGTKMRFHFEWAHGLSGNSFAIMFDYKAMGAIRNETNVTRTLALSNFKIYERYDNFHLPYLRYDFEKRFASAVNESRFSKCAEFINNGDGLGPNEVFYSRGEKLKPQMPLDEGINVFAEKWYESVLVKFISYPQSVLGYLSSESKAALKVDFFALKSLSDREKKGDNDDEFSLQAIDVHTYSPYVTHRYSLKVAYCFWNRSSANAEKEVIVNIIFKIPILFSGLYEKYDQFHNNDSEHGYSYDTYHRGFSYDDEENMHCFTEVNHENDETRGIIGEWKNARKIIIGAVQIKVHSPMKNIRWVIEAMFDN